MNHQYKFHGQPLTQVCGVCGMRLPHSTRVAQEYHKAKEKEDQQALKQWREKTEKKLISGEFWR